MWPFAQNQRSHIILQEFAHRSVPFCGSSRRGEIVALNSSSKIDEQLLERSASGDASAVNELLARYRPRLKRMVALRMDRRLAARVDPSDVVQEAVMHASQRLAEYVRDPPMPFYP